MSKLTPEQQLAVDKSNTNIIVSAGAGSGKTTVLKERVLRELKEGVKINDLIILTFTNNAAAEMKERIRKIISTNPDVSEQALYLDSAYITTFDSFAQSLVKKYNYLLNISKNFSIVDSSIVNIEIKKIVDDIFESMYADEDEDFAGFIKDFCIKSDKHLRLSITEMYKSTANIIDKDKFFKTYIETFYSDEYIARTLAEYEDYVFKYQTDVADLFDQLGDETLKLEAHGKNVAAINDFLNASTIDELRNCVGFSLTRNSNDTYSDLGVEIKNKIGAITKELKGYLEYSKDELKEHYLSTKRNAQVIITILQELDKRILQFKVAHNSYEFNDIALKAIELVRDFEDVREEIKNKTHEIMIDEYQDTSDIQETFISYIENNNVYMVGDIKQSIYRFRNANPYIFKNKYDAYKNGINGFKIDLNKNFRSRDEVINNINLIFNSVMSNDIGGADYKVDHQMVFGNTKYDTVKDNINYDMEILNYKLDGTSYKEDEVEAFIIADDILKRINNKEKTITFVNDEMVLKDITFSDFVILVDKGKNFELLKKILESKGIPATIDKDISIKEEDEIFILKNLLKLIVAIKNKCFDNEFKHAYLAIARSFVFKMSDEDIFNIFCDNTFKESELYKKAETLTNYVDNLSNKELLMKIIFEFDIINKLMLVGDVETRVTKLEYFVNNALNLNNFGYDVNELINYFDEVLTSDEDVKMSLNSESGNSVKIMTIHKSKGLEYNIVYLPYLNSDFTRNINKTDYQYSNKYGFVLPFYINGVGKTYISTIYKYNERIETLSEKIRLFYVALTRPKEKFIMINKLDDKVEAVQGDISFFELSNIKSLGGMMNLLGNKVSSYSRLIDLDTLNISDDYNLVSNYNYEKHIAKSNVKLHVKENNKEYQLLDTKHFSKALNKVIDKEFRERLDFGTYMHYLFEVLDLKNNNVDELNIKDEYKTYLNNFLESDLLKNIGNAKIYKEHEIRFIEDGAIYHGFIDLLLEYNDHFDIIDYKLSNIKSDEYVVQLNGYRDYIVNKYHKDANIYLYSIKNNEFLKLN